MSSIPARRSAAASSGPASSPVRSGPGEVVVMDPSLPSRRSRQPPGAPPSGTPACRRAAVGSTAALRSLGSAGRRGLVLALLLGLVGLLLGLVHRAVGVLRRAVDRVEDQRVGPGVHEIVLLAGGDDDEVALGHLLLRAGDHRLAGAADEGEDLVDVLVHLLADLTARRNRHDHELAVLAGPEHPPEVGAL